MSPGTSEEDRATLVRLIEAFERSQQKIADLQTSIRRIGTGDKLSYLARAWRLLHNSHMNVHASYPSPVPWTFADRIYGLAHCLIDRDGRVIGVNLRLRSNVESATSPLIISNVSQRPLQVDVLDLLAS